MIQSPETIKIALVEDNLVNRNTFYEKMSGFKDLTILFDALNGHDFLEKMKIMPPHMHPKLVFMDIEMPGLDGIETTKMAKALYPELHIIVLTVFEDNEKIFEAIQSGASGYLLKHETSQSLYAAISEVLAFGGAPMSPAIARKTLQLLASGVPQKENKSASVNLDAYLSEREIEILKHTVNGWDAKRIAQELKISVLTVRKHVANTYLKLHVNSKAQVISLAHKQNWFS